MKRNFMRIGIGCIIIAALFAGALFQYMTADNNQHYNAVLVMATLK